MDQSVTRHTLFEHFAGRLSPLQRTLLEDWLREPIHRELYYQALEEWERLNAQYLADDETALAESLAQLESWEQERIPAVGPLMSPNPFRFTIRWAATLTGLVLLIAGLYLGRSYFLNRTIATAYGEIRRETLPDGSTVTLNANSSLRVPRFGFGPRTREVFLKGEAAFSVKHTPDDQRFVVKTSNDFDVVVLGTEFSVYARQRGSRVVLNRGKVQLAYHPGNQTHQLTMKPGDLVSLDHHGHAALQRVAQPEAHVAWKDHRFAFRETSVQEIADLLNETYGLTVVLNSPELADRTVSGTFQAATADEFLQVIAELLEVNYHRQSNEVTFFD